MKKDEKKSHDEKTAQLKDKLTLQKIWPFDIIEVRTGRRLTYFFLNHEKKTGYHFEVCLN